MCRLLVLVRGIGIALILLSTPRVIWADDQQTTVVCPICGHANNAKAAYGERATSTLARGAANAAFGWTEMIRQPAQEVKDGGNVFMGMAKGAGYSIKRTLAGFGELLTFWTPQPHQGRFQFSDDCPLCMKRREKYERSLQKP